MERWSGEDSRPAFHARKFRAPSKVPNEPSRRVFARCSVLLGTISTAPARFACSLGISAGGCCSAWVLDYNFFLPKSEKFVWVLKKIYRNLPFHHYEVVIARYSGHCSAFLPAGLLGPLARSVNYRSMLARSVCSLGYIGDSSM